MFTSPRSNETDGGYSRLPIMASASIYDTAARFLACSSACTLSRSTLEAASAWPFASVSSNSMAVASGWRNLSPGKDPFSAFPPPPDEGPSAPAETSTASTPLTIWLIEDNPADAFVMTEALKSSGLLFQLQSVVDGEAALELLRAAEDGEQVLPALILLDLNLPKISGLEVLSQIRAAARCGRVPVIVVTSSEAPSDLSAIRELSATAYFRKPTSLDAFMKLSDLVRQVLV